MLQKYEEVCYKCTICKNYWANCKDDNACDGEDEPCGDYKKNKEEKNTQRAS